MARIRRTIGVCPQFELLWPTLTAREHLRLFATIKGVAPGRINAEVEERLADVSLTADGDIAAGSYSGGMRRRLSVAISLIGNPDVVFLDEPTTGLHFCDVDRLLGVLQQLLDNGNTVVVVEHNLDVMMSADYIIDLGPEGGHRGGSVIVEGSPEAVAASRVSYTGRYLADRLS